MTDLKVRHIPTDLVNKFMPLCRHFIEAGLENSDLSYGQASVYLSMGAWHLLIVLNEKEELVGAYTLMYTNEPNDRAATVVSAAGRGLAHPCVFEQVCEIAKDFGATKIQALAQEAHARLYRRAGLVEKATLMERKLWVV